MALDGIPTARVPSRPYAGGKYGIRQVSTGKLLPLKRPFGSITAAYAWLDRSGYPDDYEACAWVPAGR